MLTFLSTFDPLHTHAHTNEYCMVIMGLTNNVEITKRKKEVNEENSACRVVDWAGSDNSFNFKENKFLV